MTLENASVLHHYGAAALAAPPRVIPTMAFASSVKTSETDKGTHLIEGIRIFKAGTFADSMGVVRTWEHVHLDQMVMHFKLLKENDFFPNVPVRVDHSWSARDVVGYFVDVYRDPEDENFLAATIEITEPDAFEKWERGTYRSRSLEVGMYETNGENPQVYFPVVMGLAFVDIPAVEGLHAKGTSPGTFSQQLQDDDKETAVTEQEFLRACEYAAWLDAANYAQAQADEEAAINYAAAIEAHQANAAALGLSANHSAAQPVAFRVGGQPTQDGIAVQRHIDGLEAFRRETIDSGRASYVDDLAKFGKIGQPQVESLKNLVKGMTDEQYDAFKASYDSAGTAAIFGQFGQQSGGDPAPGGAVGTTAEQIADLEEIVQNHRRRGATEEAIKEMASFKKLQTLKAQQGQG